MHKGKRQKIPRPEASFQRRRIKADSSSIRQARPEECLKKCHKLQFQRLFRRFQGKGPRLSAQICGPSLFRHAPDLIATARRQKSPKLRPWNFEARRAGSA